ncbi:MAG: hypothetical protein FJ253_03980 [Phycisphaerae bacterium]|nr:hypothetical protein [Phycisphaerae bacterium]
MAEIPADFADDQDVPAHQPCGESDGTELLMPLNRAPFDIAKRLLAAHGVPMFSLLTRSLSVFRRAEVTGACAPRCCNAALLVRRGRVPGRQWRSIVALETNGILMPRRRCRQKVRDQKSNWIWKRPTHWPPPG